MVELQTSTTWKAVPIISSKFFQFIKARMGMQLKKCKYDVTWDFSDSTKYLHFVKTIENPCHLIEFFQLILIQLISHYQNETTNCYTYA